jgi:hypothetical protein
VTVGDVDGDLLLALGGQAIGEQGEVQLLAAGPGPLGVDAQRLQLIGIQGMGLVEQPPDQRALAVVDRAAQQEAQQRLALLGLQQGGDPRRRVGGGAQKYPSCFLASIEALASRSMTRPWRSEVVVATISAITFSSVSASLSIAPVSG